MAEEKKIRCPYCRKVFLWKVELKSDNPHVNLGCPYCKEQLVLKRDMLMRK